ncbi:MAG: S41 family peptidase [Anaerovoracaceae bacterium]|jgi:carboxyl-terminal processing protease
MKIKKKSFILLMIVFMLLGGVLGWGITSLLGPGFRSSSGDLQYMKTRYDKLETIWSLIDSKYYQKVDDSQLETSLYRGLVAGLNDPYSNYMTKDEYKNWEAGTLGVYDGIGLQFAEDKKGRMVVLKVIADTPADRAGIEKKDILLSVDGKTYDDSSTMANAIRGKAGTRVKIVYERDGRKHSVTMTRASIQSITVEEKQLSGRIGLITVSAFEENTADDFRDALRSCEKRHDKGLIIDLRDNGGGLVDEAVDIADRLMGKGTITYLEDRQGKKEYYRSDSSCTKLPYVVLVNDSSASAAEILTAAVKDNTDNPIVGQTTFGKGVVQETQKLSDGSALTLTVMQYYSPKGSTIHKKGVKPDYVVKGRAAQMKKARQLLRH